MSGANRHLRIAIAEDEADTRQFLRELLPSLGHEVVVVAEDGRALVEQCPRARPDLIIADLKMPELDGIAAATAVNAVTPVPVVLLTAYHAADVLERAAAVHVMAYLTKPVKPVDLQAAITLAMVRFDQYQQLSREAADLRQSLEDRKLIERAKGAIMRRLRIEEVDAFHHLRRLASNQNRKLVDIAQQIIEAESVFQLIERC